MPLSEWIEANMRLPEGLAAKPGPVRLWPFQRGIADAITDPAIERVTVRKSARVGFSTLLTGTLASYIANEPAPLLYLLPTEDDCFDAATEVLTERGWMLFKDLASERLATVNLETDRIEYQTPSRLIAKPYSGDMVRISTRRLDVLVTPEHRMVTYVRRMVDGLRRVDETPSITLAGDLTSEHRIKVTANGLSAIEPGDGIDAGDIEADSLSRVPYDGMVYCATVPNGTLVCRRNGKVFIAGNCRDYVVSDMEPVFDATPAVRGLLSDAQDETGRNTIRHRRFPGGSLKIVAAKSPRNLRRHTVRILLIDEEDGMEVTPEGDPVDLAIKRTMTFANRKIIRGSTPVDLETSTICREYDASDRRVYEMKCVECGEFSEPQWSDIRWDKGKPETARWACPHCGTLVAERYKLQMVSDGRWRATRPEVEGHAGFKLNALISPHYNASWAKLAAEYIEVHEDPDRLRTFKNTLLGDPWSEAIDAIDPEELLATVEPFGLNVSIDGAEPLRIPVEVLVITAGVDVQDDRLEMNVYGWSRDGQAYALGHFVIWGSPGDKTTWAELDAALTTKWDHPLGGKIGVDAACIDAGDGGWVDEVYEFCWPRARRKVMAIKGAAGSRPVIEGSKGKVAKGTLSGKGRLWIVGVDTVKSQLLMRLSRYRETIHFSQTLPLAWFEQLLSERRVIKKIGGKPVKRFERIAGMAAEALDATVYAIAARQTLNINFDERIGALSTPQTTQAQAAPAPAARANFITRGSKPFLSR
jgi:phage terminase large subunit GpA-like protein